MECNEVEGFLDVESSLDTACAAEAGECATVVVDAIDA